MSSNNNKIQNGSIWINVRGTTFCTKRQLTAGVSFTGIYLKSSNSKQWHIVEYFPVLIY